MEDQVLTAISETLSALDKITSWALIVLLAMVISIFQKDKKIKIGGFDIDLKYSSYVTFAILCSINFVILRLLNNLIFLFDASDSKAEQAKFLINTNSWVFNPFTETSGALSYVTDNLGLALLLLLWWLGFHAGLFLYRVMQGTWGVNLLAILYSLLGLASMALIILFMSKVNEGTMIIKQILLFITIPIGAFGIGLFFRTDPKEE